MAFQGADIATGSLRVGGREAAALKNCSLHYAENGRDWRVTADCPTWNAVYLAAKGPFELRLFLRHSTWRWKGVAATHEVINGGAACRCAVTGTGEPESLAPAISPT